MCVSCIHIRLIGTFVYGFCAHCAAFLYVYSFCLRWAGFAYIYSLCARWAAFYSILSFFQFSESPNNPIMRVLWFFWKFWWSDLEGSLVFWKSRWCYLDLLFLCDHLWRLNRLDDLIFRVPPGSLSNDLYVIIGYSGWYNLHGSVDFIIQESARDSTSDIILDYFLLFLADLDRAIHLSRWSNITVHYDALW